MPPRKRPGIEQAVGIETLLNVTHERICRRWWSPDVKTYFKLMRRGET